MSASDKATVVGVIPARWASTRLPGKSLVPLCGKPLIAWVVERAARAARLDALIVATDDTRIVDAVAGLDARAVMTRADHPSGTDRVAEAVADIDADIIVNIQGDEPLIDPVLIDRLVGVMVDDPDWDMATAVTPFRDEEDVTNPAAVKAVFAGDGRALYFSRSVIPHVRDADAAFTEPVHWRHLGIYAYRRACLARLIGTPPTLLERAECLEQLRALHLGCRMAVVQTDDRGVGVDTPADVAYAEALIREAGHEN